MPPCRYDRISFCVECGTEFIARRSGPLAKYCGLRCKNDARARAERNRRAKANRAISPCDNPYCEEWFTSHINSRKRTCSPDCSYVVSEGEKAGKGARESAAILKGFLSASRIWFFPCIDCGALTTRKWKRPGKICVCRPCSKARYQAHNARKNHKRRAAGPKIMSVHEIAKRDGRRCHICHRMVDMSLSGIAKWGPTIDHLIPVSDQGTNDPENLALAHRHCNVARGNRGHVQLLMVS